MRLKANLGFQTGGKVKVAKSSEEGTIRGSMRSEPMGKTLGIVRKRKGGDFGPAISVDLSVRRRHTRWGVRASTMAHCAGRGR